MISLFAIIRIHTESTFNISFIDCLRSQTVQNTFPQSFSQNIKKTLFCTKVLYFLTRKMEHVYLIIEEGYRSYSDTHSQQTAIK